jgi:hypothetical protein
VHEKTGEANDSILSKLRGSTTDAKERRDIEAAQRYFAQQKKNAGKTVDEILKGKKGSIKDAPLDEGAPSWAEIRNLKWEDIVKGAQQGKRGYRTFKKLLEQQRFDK